MSDVPHTVKKMVEAYPECLTEGSLRKQIFEAETNGLAKYGAVVRVGWRVFVIPSKYFAWMTSNQTRA